MKRKKIAQHRKPVKHLRNKHLGSRIFLVVIIFLIILIGVLFLVQERVFEKKEIVIVNLKDECSLLLNNLIHTIKTEDNCKMLCQNECGSRGLNYVGREFYLNSTACNDCRCRCR